MLLRHGAIYFAKENHVEFRSFYFGITNARIKKYLMFRDGRWPSGFGK
jgi:hypothetical protein